MTTSKSIGSANNKSISEGYKEDASGYKRKNRQWFYKSNVTLKWNQNKAPNKIKSPSQVTSCKCAELSAQQWYHVTGKEPQSRNPLHWHAA